MGKGGGSPAPTQQTVNNTSIPSYAQPYVEDMLGRTAALTDINQNPYQNYGGQRIAGFTPMQTQAMTNVGNMQIAPQLGQATGFAGQSGTGSLQTAGQMAGVGQSYQNMATDPAEMQKYMNPYIQQALNPQLQLLNQQQALQGQGIAAKAAGQGAFGGNRATLAQGLNAQNYALAGQQAIGQGYNEAFRQAQQAQQFGANLGLQGLQGALAGYGQANQAAATLGQLGQTQYGQQMGINQAQMQAGAMQQALQQQGLDVNYQDFLKERNYPYQQLAFQSDMMRGLPLSQSAQTMYAAPPSFASQAGGLGMTGLGIYGMAGGFKGAKGGLMDAKSYKEGGTVGYAGGGKIDSMSVEQLTEMLSNPTISPIEAAAIEERLMLLSRMKNNPQTSQIMGGGLDTVPSGDMFEAAGGGIVAFSEGATVKSKKPEGVMDYRDLIRQRLTAQETGNPFAKSEEEISAIKQEMEARKASSPWEALAMAGLGTMAGTSQYGATNLGLGGLEGLKSYARSNAENAADRKLLLQQQVEAEKSKYARDSANLNSMIAAQGQMDTRDIGLQNARATASSAAASKANTEYNKNWNNFQLRVGAEKNNLMNQKSKTFDYEQNPNKLDVDAYKNIYYKTPPDIRAELKLPDPKEYEATTSGQPAAPAVAPAAVPTGSVANKVPPPAAIDMLRSKDSPEMRAKFDAIFGPGAAKKALGK